MEALWTIFFFKIRCTQRPTTASVTHHRTQRTHHHLGERLEHPYKYSLQVSGCTWPPSGSTPIMSDTSGLPGYWRLRWKSLYHHVWLHFLLASAYFFSKIAFAVSESMFLICALPSTSMSPRSKRIVAIDVISSIGDVHPAIDVTDFTLHSGNSSRNRCVNCTAVFPP